MPSVPLAVTHISEVSKALLENAVSITPLSTRPHSAVSSLAGTPTLALADGKVRRDAPSWGCCWPRCRLSKRSSLPSATPSDFLHRAPRC